MVGSAVAIFMAIVALAMLRTALDLSSRHGAAYASLEYAGATVMLLGAIIVAVAA